ncbi:hypothetical protein RUND412_001209 [Rhizina undulata]
MASTALRAPLRCKFAVRSFSTSAPTLQIGPESPRFIEIPRPPKVKYRPPPYKKGKLPEPKNLFPAQIDKTSQEYLDAATAEPTKVREVPKDPEMAEYIRWKAAMAASRRKNLREGIVELARKKEEKEKKRAEIQRERSEAREALLHAKEREDVRLTLPTVLSTLKESMTPVDPDREERLRIKEERRIAKEQKKIEERLEDMHALYVNARSFILTEAQLDAAIEKTFVPKDIIFKNFPPTVSDMLVEKGDFARSKPSTIGGMFGDRNGAIMEVAAALTGGRMEVKDDKADERAFMRNL